MKPVKMLNIPILAVCLLLLSGCSGKAQTQMTQEAAETPEKTSASRELFAMDTFMSLQAYGERAEEAMERAAEEIERLDACLSAENQDSEVAALNRTGSASLSEDAAYLLEQSLRLSKETDGAFDIAIYPVMEAWGFVGDEFFVPSDEELEDLLLLCDIQLVQYEEESRQVRFLKEGVKIGFGGIAKGYASSRIMDIYREEGLESGLVNLGGNVQALGGKPDGSGWRVAIQHPQEDSQKLGVLTVKDRAVITSGGYERYFERDGVTYHHIIDPSTGKPADSGLISVTIVSPDGTLADGLSTSLFIMGEEEAEAFWREHSDEFEMILMTEDGTLWVTEGLAEDFVSDYEVSVIKNPA